MKNYLLYLPILLFVACGDGDKQANQEATIPDAPLTKSKNPESFNTAYSTVLNNYYSLKDGLVASNATVNENVDKAAKNLAEAAKALPVKTLQADTQIIATAQNFVDMIIADAKTLTDSTALKAKRNLFKNISENMYTLTQTVQYDRAKVYHQFCPMAFDNQGAHWLSKDIEIRNPYFADAMLECGEITDTLKFNQ